MKKPTITPGAEALISEALAIEAEAATNAGALGFMARAMIQATLPHKKVVGSHFQRRNGNFTLTLLAPPDPGLPYGSVPRLLLAWLTTEATRTNCRELVLGDSLSAFMRELGMVPTGGRWGSITRLKDQARRLFRSTVSCDYKDGKVDADVGFRLATGTMFWWDAKHTDQERTWQSTITLTEEFFREIVKRPVPVDMRALAALKKSPLALDIYCTLTHRASYMTKASTIPWTALAAQFGSGYAEARFFKRAFLAELRKVATVYAAAEFEVSAAGLTIKPSRPHITKK